LAVNLDFHELVCPAWMNNDLLNNLPNAVIGRQTAVLVCFGQSPFQVPYLVAVGVRRIRMEYNCWRGNGGNLRLDLVALSLQGCQAVAQGAAWRFGQQNVYRFFDRAVDVAQPLFEVCRVSAMR
jgi:hypothetical protein